MARILPTKKPPKPIKYKINLSDKKNMEGVNHMNVNVKEMLLSCKWEKCNTWDELPKLYEDSNEFLYGLEVEMFIDRICEDIARRIKANIDEIRDVIEEYNNVFFKYYDKVLKDVDNYLEYDDEDEKLSINFLKSNLFLPDITTFEIGDNNKQTAESLYQRFKSLDKYEKIKFMEMMELVEIEVTNS